MSKVERQLKRYLHEHFLPALPVPLQAAYDLSPDRWMDLEDLWRYYKEDKLDENRLAKWYVGCLSSQLQIEKILRAVPGVGEVAAMLIVEGLYPYEMTMPLSQESKESMDDARYNFADPPARIPSPRTLRALRHWWVENGGKDVVPLYLDVLEPLP